MSDSPFSDDELLSSHLDGELTAEEAARLEARLTTEPDLRDRLVAMRGTAELATTPVAPLRTGDRDRLLAAALAASSTATNVADLGAARPRKARWRTGLITVAAGVAALAIAVPVLRSIDNGDGDSSFSETAIADSAGDEATPADAAEEAVLQAPAAAAMLESSSLADAADDTPAEAFEAGEASPAAEPDDMTTTDTYSTLRGFIEPNAGFDPLPDDLGAVPSQSALISALTDAWNDYANRAADGSSGTAPVDEPEGDGGDDTDFTNGPDVLERAFGYLDRFGGCGSAIDELVDLIDELPPVLAVDWSIAQSNGITFTVGLFLLPEEEAFAVVIDPSTCTTIDRLFLD